MKQNKRPKIIVDERMSGDIRERDVYDVNSLVYDEDGILTIVSNNTVYTGTPYESTSRYDNIFTEYDGKYDKVCITVSPFYLPGDDEIPPWEPLIPMHRKLTLITPITFLSAEYINSKLIHVPDTWDFKFKSRGSVFRTQRVASTYGNIMFLVGDIVKKDGKIIKHQMLKVTFSIDYKPTEAILRK